MNRLIVLVALLVPVCLAGVDPHKEAMIKDNRTPKERVPEFNSACDECKMLVERFDEAMKDPEKLEELKNLLSLLCESTSYARECKLIVSRLDVIIKEMAPYLQDPTAVCTKLHMCGNARLQKVHRLALVYAKKYLNRVDGNGLQGVMCEECEFAVGELKALFEERGTQAQIQEYIREYVCKHMGQYQGMCDELVEQVLPEMFQELEQFLQNSKQVCTDIGLCQGQNVLVNGQRLHPADNSNARNVPKTYRLKSFMTMLNNLQTRSGISAECIECEAGMGVILGALKGETIRKKVCADVQELACTTILPVDFKDGCNDFLTLYLETVFMLTVDQFTGTDICNMLHMCDGEKSRAIQRLSATEKAAEMCEACTGITDFLRREVNSGDFESTMEEGIEKYFCSNLRPSAQAFCENVVKNLTPRAIRKLASMLDSETICKDDLHMCTV